MRGRVLGVEPAGELSRRFVVVCLTLLLLVGFWLRARGLSSLGLTVDEGIQAMAVRGIVEHGVPVLDSGIVYGRNPGVSYLQAGVVKVLGLGELSLRLTSVAFSVATILVGFLLAARLFGDRVGLLAATILTFSLWELEFARYGRPYALFQCMFLLSLYCFYRAFLEGTKGGRAWFLVAFALTLPMHEISVLVLTCFVIPLLSTTLDAKQKRSVVLWGAAAAAGWALYRRLFTAIVFSFNRASGVLVGWPEPGPSQQLRRAFTIPLLRRLPLEPFELLLRQQPVLAMLLGLVPLAASGFLLRRWYFDRQWFRAALSLVIVWAAFVQQFGVVLLLLLLYVVLFVGQTRQLFAPALRVVGVSVALCFAFWAAFLAVTSELSTSDAISSLFGFPSIYSYLLKWCIRGWPLMTAVLTLGSALLLVRFLADRGDHPSLFALGSLWIPALAAAMFVAPWSEARYFFHLFPLMVILYAFAVCEGGRWLVTRIPWRGPLARATVWVAVLAAGLWLSQEAYPASAWAVGNRTYRSPKDPIRAVMNWRPYALYHPDRKGPSLHVRSYRREHDRVLALGPPHVIQVYDFYVEGVDVQVGREFDEGPYRGEDGRLIERATGATITKGLRELQTLLQESEQGAIWLLADRPLLDAQTDWYGEDIERFVGSLPVAELFLGLDGQTFAARVIGREDEATHTLSDLLAAADD